MPHPTAPRRGRINIQLLIAGFIALSAIVSYVMRMERDPLTGELRALALSPEQEVQMGKQAAPKMADQMGGAIDPQRSREAARVQQIGQRLVQNYKAAEGKYAKSFNFYLLADDRTVNAFALPGGQIFITSALYNALENEAQLAGVLGHEIGHVVHRHSSEQMAKSELGQKLVGAVAVGSGDYSTAMIANVVNQAVNQSYGRNDELESDSWGLENMAAAGYDPRELIVVMQVLKKASGGGGRGPDIFASHPDPDHRIEVIKSYLQKRWPSGMPSNLSRGERLR